MMIYIFLIIKISIVNFRNMNFQLIKEQMGKTEFKKFVNDLRGVSPSIKTDSRVNK